MKKFIQSVFLLIHLSKNCIINKTDTFAYTKFKLFFCCYKFIFCQRSSHFFKSFILHIFFGDTVHYSPSFNAIDFHNTLLSYKNTHSAEFSHDKIFRFAQNINPRFALSPISLHHSKSYLVLRPSSFVLRIFSPVFA